MKNKTDVNRGLVVDTSVFVENINIIGKILEDGTYDIKIPQVVLEELDDLKDGTDSKKSYRARTAIKFILNNLTKIEIVNLDEADYTNKPDNKILNVARDSGYQIMTFDNCMKLKAKNNSIDLVDSKVYDKRENKNYTGYTEIYSNDTEQEHNIAKIYTDKHDNALNMNNNEYLIVKNETGDTLDRMKYTSEKGFNTFTNKSIDSKIMGNVRALDDYQSCLVDSLHSNQMTMVKGKAGSGKSLLSLAYAMHMLEKNKFNKLIIFANPVCSRNSARLGFYPGTRDEKVLDSFLGSMLASKLGGMAGVLNLMVTDKLNILPFSDIRGFDTAGMKAIVYIVEAQNLDIDLMKLAIQRVSDDCKLIIDGDYNSQVDMTAYEGNLNGMRRVSEVYRGQDFYGEIELKNIYRSKMAKIADLL